MNMKIVSRETVKNKDTGKYEIVMTVSFPVERIDSMLTTEEFVEAFRIAVEEYNGRNL